MKRMFVLATLVATLALIALGCAPAPAAQPTTAPSAGQSNPTAVVQVVTATPPPGTPAPTAAPAPKIKNPDTIISASIGEPESLDPAWDYETAGGEVMQAVYDTLVTFKRESVTDLVGLLAKDWKVSDDGKTYTFTLRPEATFHSGNPVKASDVAYTFVRSMTQDRASGPQWILLQPFFGLDIQRFLDPSSKAGEKGSDVVNSQFKGDFAAACQSLQSKIVADDAAGTVTMKLAQPYGPFLLTLANGWGSIVEKAAVVKLGGWDGDCKNASKFNDPAAEKSELFEKEVGSGPFKLERWDHGNEYSLVANDNYWLKTPLWDGGPSGAPKIKHYVVKIIPEWGTRYSMLLAGDADIANVPRANVSQMEALVKEECDAANKCTPKNANGFVTLHRDLPQANLDTVQFNWNVPVEGGNNSVGTGKLDGNGIPPAFFSDIHIRKAFNYCFDWKTFIDQYWKGEAQQALGPILQGYLGYDPNQAKYSYDIAKCKAEFDAASKDKGYEGLNDKGFFVQYTYNTGNTARQTAGQILKDGLAKANPKFKIGIADEPFPVFLRDRDAGRLPVYMAGWLEDFHDPHDWVSPFLTSQGSYSGTGHWSPDLYKTLDDLVAQAVSKTNKDDRAKLYAQIQGIAYDNATAIYIEQPLLRSYTQQWVKGYYYNPIYSAYWGGWIYTLSKGQ